MKIKLLSVTILFLFTGILNSQSLNLRFSTYFYGWQRADTITATGSEGKTMHLRGYENLLLEFNKNKWSFNTLLQTEEDVIKKNGDGFNYRVYNLYVKGSNLFNVLDLKLGRQYVFAGAGKGPIDGLYFKVKAGKNKEYQIAGYSGVLTPYDYSFKNYPKKIQDNFMAGGQFSYYGVRDLFASLSYMVKNRQLPSYYAFRLDTALNTKEILIEPDSKADMIAGLDFNYTYLMKHNFYGKAYFDVYRQKLYRGEFNARIRVMDNMNVLAGYTYREPMLSYNTIFWVFSYKRTHEVEGGADYTLKNGINVYAKVSDVIYDKTVDSLKNNSLKINVGFSHPSFGLSFVRYMGYSGESDGVNGYYMREIVKEKLSTTAAVSFSRYYLGEFEYDKVNSFSGLIGITFRPTPQVSIDAQGQFLFNRIYKLDSRFLIGFNYWLFKKL
jgi:hypothetical protein